MKKLIRRLSRVADSSQYCLLRSETRTPARAYQTERSEISFRRQGSSGLVWDDKFLRELNRAQREDEIKSQGHQQQDEQEEHHQDQQIKDAKLSIAVGSIERSRSNGGGRGFRTGKVSPAIEPPSPRLSACGFCSAFGKNGETRRRPKSVSIEHSLR
ncbi:hypothetical protein ACSBR1_039979 [Camellia fascicularis]